MLKTKFLFIFLFAVSLSAAGKVEAQQARVDITKTSLEELMNIEVVSASKDVEKFQTTASAIYVLTGDDIRRSGARTVPDALRLVPGVQVASIDANKWAISIRGFNSRTANKLLVLIDGRSVYDPLFSGVIWESKHVMLEDIDRIEVIRGPGGAIWGANAVNGVINIITKNASQTQGTLIAAGGGSFLPYFGSARQGVKLGEDTFFRVFGDYQRRNEGFLEQDTDDNSWWGRTGFRMDSQLNERDSLTMQGDYHNGHHGSPMEEQLKDEETSGANFLTRWNRKFSGDEKLTVQFYYDHTELLVPAILGEDRDSLDFELVHSLPLHERHRLTWGLRYRFSTDDITDDGLLGIDPTHRDYHLFSLFVDDKIALFDRSFFLTLGSKIEHNDVTGVEVQPNVRVSWQVDERNVTWGAISRAVRIPSRLEDDAVIDLPGITLRGNRGLEAEDLIAYELGHRILVNDTLYFDVATFYNTYDKLVTTEGSTLENGAEGDTYGAELAATYRPLDWWKITAAYHLLRMNIELERDSTAELSAANTEANNPRHEYSMHSKMELPAGLELDAVLRYVDSLDLVPSYIVADVRLAARVTDEVELSVVGRNLFDDHHFEQAGNTTQVESSVYGMVRVEF